MMSEKVILGSRGSDLALWQARFVKAQLETLGVEVEIQIIVTQGDAIQQLSFDKMEGKGFFTKEIEEALLRGEIDLAVHSLKDLPTSSPPGLQIAALSYREDPRDLLLIRKDKYNATAYFGLPENAVVGTSSARRKVQLKAHFPHIELKDLRGNVPTRIQKCRDGLYDAIVLAAAGVSRLQLNLDDFVAVYLPTQQFIPAPAQGVLGLQIREGDQKMLPLMQQLHQPQVAETVALERQILADFEGGCQMPLGVFCTRENDQWVVYTAKAADANTLPKFIRIAGNDKKQLAQSSLALANKTHSGNILITHKPGGFSRLTTLLEAAGISVNMQSFINTSAIPVSSWPDSEWLFFGSRNAVKFTFEQHPALFLNKKIGAVGPGTAASLRKLGIEVDYVGQHADVEAVASEFLQQTTAETSVLLPLGKQSLRTLAKSWAGKIRLNCLEVYTTEALLLPPLPKTYERVLFTSPSNVDAWAKSQKYWPKACFAMGLSTAAALEKHGQKPIISHGFDEIALATAIFSVH
jgi:hydroxymethylbilane synthase